ncbi:hypothetical protein [Pseudomonas sp. 8 R 14]|uniref:hypothetical protein n=1 Tax=Pseudomonas sp. 8 R 14 TaxID=1844092 RepID=UPI0008128004|nr:hypothetical protein [Pseudomonas sp. 8 R 14]CRM53807.1 hypothetical protein [Pseudomonas sp. 8 R 14]
MERSIPAIDAWNCQGQRMELIMLIKTPFDFDAPLISIRDKLLIKDVSPQIFNAQDPSLTSEAKEALLELQFRNITFRDAIASGNATINGKYWQLSTRRPIESFKGLVMEAALCRECGDNPFTIGRRTFAWCTGRLIGEVSNKQTSEHIPFITANKKLQDNPLTARFYDPASPYDMHFYRINDQGNAELATEVGDYKGVVAGIQVKAIQGNEKSEIIQKLIKGRYTRVVTMLRHKSGEHSYEVCVRLLNKMQKDGEITAEQALNIISRLTYPEFLGLEQHKFDSYSEWINLAYGRFERWEEDLFSVEAIGLEVAMIRSGASGIVMPDTPQLILPPSVH